MRRRQSREVRSQNFEEIIDNLPDDDDATPHENSTRHISCRMIPPQHLAQQMTVLDSDAFNAIHEKELVDGAWLKEEKNSLSPNIIALVKRFNWVSYWVIEELLAADGQRDRYQKLEYFIKLAKKLHQYNNVHGLIAVVSALQSAPIYRLHRTWALLKEKYSDQLERLEEFISIDDHYKNVRDHLSTTKTPCVPYIGLYLTDLMHLVEKRKRSSNKKKVEEEIVSCTCICDVCMDVCVCVWKFMWMCMCVCVWMFMWMCIFFVLSFTHTHAMNPFLKQ
eukprot:m.97063 g.97063  ORF g.97063 m.97063 type:complete len:278 (+) comp12484_c0_seq1:257-1090(+)